jgi:hypothetical protein
MTLRQTGNSIGSLLQNRSSVTLAADQIDELKEKFLKVYFTFEYIYIHKIISNLLVKCEILLIYLIRLLLLHNTF